MGGKLCFFLRWINCDSVYSPVVGGTGSRKGNWNSSVILEAMFRIRMFIPDPNFSHPGSRVIKSPDHGSGSASKNLGILTQKVVCKLSEIWSGFFIPDPDPDYFPIQDPGFRVQKSTRSHPDPQHCQEALLSFTYPLMCAYCKINMTYITDRNVFRKFPTSFYDSIWHVFARFWAPARIQWDLLFQWREQRHFPIHV